MSVSLNKYESELIIAALNHYDPIDPYEAKLSNNIAIKLIEGGPEFENNKVTEEK